MAASFDDIVSTVLPARARDIDGFTVGRVLPAVERRAVGPFVFFDHMGPAAVPAGRGLDVRPHPHIGLATVTALFAGEIVHRDSLGSLQVIRPGEVNWMIAGRGIVHSERTSEERRATGQAMHGLQLWVALPEEHEEDEPEFSHHEASALPGVEGRGYRGRVLAGTAYGETSPVAVRSPMFYVQAEIDKDAAMPVPDGLARSRPLPRDRSRRDRRSNDRGAPHGRAPRGRPLRGARDRGVAARAPRRRARRPKARLVEPRVVARVADRGGGRVVAGGALPAGPR